MHRWTVHNFNQTSSMALHSVQHIFKTICSAKGIPPFPPRNTSVVGQRDQTLRHKMFRLFTSALFCTSNERYWIPLSCETVYCVIKWVWLLRLWKCYHSCESYWAVVFDSDTVCYFSPWVSMNPKLWPFKEKLLSNTFLWFCSLYFVRWF